MMTPPSPEPDTMTPLILNLSDVALQSRPPEFQPPEAIAERIVARRGRCGGPRPGLTGATAIAAAPFRSVSRSGQHLDCWNGE